jgi:hypothetical protein
VFATEHAAPARKLGHVRFNGEDIMRLLSVVEVSDRDDEYDTCQLTAGFPRRPSQAAGDVQSSLRRIADTFPPYVEVTTVGMGTTGQWVLRLVA